MNKEEIKALIEYINPKEIASQIEVDALTEWCEKIKREMLYNLNEMRNSLNFLYGGTAEESKTGHWIIDGCIEMCDQCGEPRDFPHWKYCPNCGAKMEGETNE